MMMHLPVMSFAVAEENQTLTVVIWDVGATPSLIAQKEAFGRDHRGAVAGVQRVTDAAEVLDRGRCHLHPEGLTTTDHKAS